MLDGWTKNRELAKKAECKICQSARGVTSHAPKRTWKQTTYTCSQCKEQHPPHNYDYKKLATLEEEGQVYLAFCIRCETKEVDPKLYTCGGCHQEKQRTEFSLARQRCKNYPTWRCLDCDFPPCEICRVKPNILKKTPYICEGCLFPPCQCGAPRPQSTKYRSTNPGMKTWICSRCRSTWPACLAIYVGRLNRPYLLEKLMVSISS